MHDSSERKKKTEVKLQSLGIPVNPHLPQIESEGEAKVRSLQEVTERATVLLAVVARAGGDEQEVILDFLNERNVWPAVSAKENEFLNNASPSKQERVNLSWRAESFWVMMWALGYLAELGYPSTCCNISELSNVIADTSAEEFLTKSTLRSHSEILDEADLVYRMDWAVVDAKLKGEPAPAGLNADVVYERHYALNWLIGYMDQDWDDITTDT